MYVWKNKIQFASRSLCFSLPFSLLLFEASELMSKPGLTLAQMPEESMFGLDNGQGLGRFSKFPLGFLLYFLNLGYHEGRLLRNLEFLPSISWVKEYAPHLTSLDSTLSFFSFYCRSEREEKSMVLGKLHDSCYCKELWWSALRIPILQHSFHDTGHKRGKEFWGFGTMWQVLIFQGSGLWVLLFVKTNALWGV